MRKILFVCTAARNRSPTAARVFARMLLSAGLAQGRDLASFPCRKARDRVSQTRDVSTNNAKRDVDISASPIKQCRDADFEIMYAGVDPLSDVQLTDGVADWATEIYVMEEGHKIILKEMFRQAEDKIRILDIEDMYFRDDPVLVEILKKKMKEYV